MVNRILQTVFTILCTGSLLAFAQSTEFERELQLGVAAHSKAEYESAVEHLKRAIFLDTSSAKAYVELGNIYRDWYCPCDCDTKADCDINDKRRTDAIDAYNTALRVDPANVEALNSLGWLSYVKAKLDESAGFYRRTLDVRPTNTEALYNLAAIDWTLSYRFRAETKWKLGVKVQSRLINHPACGDIRKTNLARVEEGISLLQRTQDVNKLADSMSWLAVLYRERADIQCGNRSAYDKDVKTSKDWARRSCAARRAGVRPSISTWYSWPAAPPPPPGTNCNPPERMNQSSKPQPLVVFDPPLHKPKTLPVAKCDSLPSPCP